MRDMFLPGVLAEPLTELKSGKQSLPPAVTALSKQKMALSRVEWALLILVILKIVTSTSGETCDKINTCSCKFSNGSTVDLKPVDGGSKGPR